MLLILGCNRSGRSLSGAATYDGRPIPHGSIMFEPDEAKGARGAGGAADIVDGIFRTRKNTDLKNGFYRITVYGYDPDLNKDNSMDIDTSLFPPYAMELEVTSETKTIDIDVPKGGGPVLPIKNVGVY